MAPENGSASEAPRLSTASLSSEDNPWVKTCPYGSAKEIPATPPSGSLSAGGSSEDVAVGSETNLALWFWGLNP